MSFRKIRHGVENFVTCSEDMCVICQYQLEDDIPLFDVLIEDIMEEDWIRIVDYRYLFLWCILL
jgi:hypothetical protein